MKNVRVITDGLRFPEGPVALSDGSVLVVEITGRTLTRVATDGGKQEVAECGGGPNGAAIGPDGKVYICNNGGFGEPSIGGRIQRVDLDSGKVEDLYDSCDGHPLRGPNDLVFDRSGGFWFTDLGKSRQRTYEHGGIYWAKADGSEIREVIFPLAQPNGIGLSPVGDTLYYAQTGDARVYRRKVSGPGQLEQPDMMDTGLLAAPGGNQMFDSLAVDADGNVCVATLRNAGITVVSPDGSHSHVPLPADLGDERFVTNMCFGGPDLRTAYLTLSLTGRLVACDWPVAGLPLAYTR